MSLIRHIISSHFNDTQLGILLISCLLGAFSIYFFQKEKFKISILFLFGAALLFRLLMAYIDPFLHLWDEQYHALVAKNLIAHPFTPMLYADPVMPYNYREWASNHIWVHKQPLFLWLMAISMKLFGVNEFAARIPSAVMLALLAPVIFRTGTLLLNKKTGFIAAFLFTFSHYQLELATGYIHTDHNDIAFMFFITCSIWSFFEYTASGSKKWIYLAGFFAGAAMLVKWIIGLLVFVGWAMAIITSREKRENIFREVGLFLKTLGIALAVFLPWQIYTFICFPAETAFVYSHNSRHFTEALEGHSGTVWYHFELLKDYYGWFAFLLPLALYFIYKDIASKEYLAAYFSYILFVYLFFTIAKTKMPLFCIIVSPLIFIAIGHLFFRAVNLLPPGKVWVKPLAFVALFITGWVSIEFKTLENDHTDRNKFNYPYRHTRTYMAKKFTELGKSLPAANYVVFNCDNMFVPMNMFYSGFTCYSGIPDQNQAQAIKKKDYAIAVINSDTLPFWVLSDTDIIKIPLEKVE